MKQIELTPTFSLSQIVYGVWRWDENKQSLKDISHILDICLSLSIDSFDHADLYNDYGNEFFFGKLLKGNNALRSQIELEKSERDRNFQNMITLVGSGTSIAAYLDLKGEKCQPILKGISVPESVAISSCKDFWIGSVIVPIGFLIILGSIGFAMKKILQKIN
jgi:hypothetical protein